MSPDGKNRCEVTCKGLGLTTTRGKRLLSDLDIQLEPGSLNLIIGPSGSGKTMLLDCISGRIPTNLSLEGAIKINGKDRNIETWPKLVVYLKQNFPAYEWQTVWETLAFAVKIKSEKQENLKEKVESLLVLLGLTNARNTYIGNLSGGEKVRVSLGIEITGDPQIILLDEPISGLDSNNAMRILEIMRNIADMGKTILVTVHQPSYKMISMFDMVSIVTNGRLVYSGTIENSIDFFRGCGYELPKNTNPTDYFLDILTYECDTEELRSESENRINSIKHRYDEIKPETKYNFTDTIKVPRRAEWRSAFNLIISRAFVSIFRDKTLLRVKALQRITIGLAFSLCFLQLGVENANAFSFRGAIFFFIINELFGNSAPILNTFGDEKQVILRERMSGFYSGYQAYFSKVISEVLLTYIYAIPYTLCVYYIIGFDPNFGRFMIFLLIILSFVILAISYGLAISIITPNKAGAQVLGVTINVFFTLYSGALSVPSTIPIWLRWLRWISPLYYIFAALCKNQLNGKPSTGALSGASSQTVDGEATLAVFEVNSLSITANIFVILGFALLFQVIGSIALHYKTRNNLKLTKKNNSTV